MFFHPLAQSAVMGTNSDSRWLSRGPPSFSASLILGVRGI